MRLEGSCHCGKIKFSLESQEYIPYQRCYCTICRKTSGGGGYAINLGGDYSTFKVDGKEYLQSYRAKIEKDGKFKKSDHQRFFCKECGSHLWAYNSNWPELIHPVATAIDTPLPIPRHNVHMMTGSKVPWLKIHRGPLDESFEKYPEFSLKNWNQINR